MQLPRRIRLQPSQTILPFDCGNADLNDFLQNDASVYLRELLAVTYLFEWEGRCIAFYSVSNDLIRSEESKSKSFWKRGVGKFLNHQKRNWKSYPAVKLARLGVDKDYQKFGLGRQILDLLKADFVTNNKTGCRFITVDAYNNPKTLGFYGRNGFEYLDETDSNKKTRLMFFDLAVFVRGGRGNLGHQEPGQ